jgi:hypothetical protein
VYHQFQNTTAVEGRRKERQNINVISILHEERIHILWPWEVSLYVSALYLTMVQPIQNVYYFSTILLDFKPVERTVTAL